MDKRIIMDRCQIDDYKQTATAFMQNVFNMDYANVFVSDDANLSDLSFSGRTPAGYLDAEKYTLNQLYQRWDAWVLGRIKEIYGIELKSTRTRLIQLFARIEQAANPTLH